MTNRPRPPAAAGRAARPGAADSESILFRLRPLVSVRQSVSDYSVSLSSLESSDFSNRDLKSGLGPSARAEVSDFLLILQNDHKNQCIMCISFLQGGRLGCRFLNFYQFSNSNSEQKNEMYKIDDLKKNSASLLILQSGPSIKFGTVLPTTEDRIAER